MYRKVVLPEADYDTHSPSTNNNDGQGPDSKQSSTTSTVSPVATLGENATLGDDNNAFPAAPAAPVAAPTAAVAAAVASPADAIASNEHRPDTPLGCASIPDDDMVPEYIREDVRRTEAEAAEKEKVLEEQRNRLELKITFGDTERVIRATKQDTCHQLLLKLWDEWDLESEPAFAAWKAKKDRLKGGGVVVEGSSGGGGEDSGGGGLDEINDDSRPPSSEEALEVSTTAPPAAVAVVPSSSSSAAAAAAAALDDGDAPLSPTPPQDTNTDTNLDTNLDLDLPLSQCRLRFYNVSMKTCTDVFDDATSGTKTLEQLYFNSYRALLLEIRSPEDTFEVYYNDGFGLLVDEYDAIIGGMKPTRTVRVPRTCTVGVLKDLICSGSKQYTPSWSCPNVARDKMRLIRIVTMGMYGSCSAEVLDDELKRLREDLNVYEGNDDTNTTNNNNNNYYYNNNYNNTTTTSNNNYNNNTVIHLSHQPVNIPSLILSTPSNISSLPLSNTHLPRPFNTFPRLFPPINLPPLPPFPSPFYPPLLPLPSSPPLPPFFPSPPPFPSPFPRQPRLHRRREEPSSRRLPRLRPLHHRQKQAVPPHLTTPLRR